MYLFDFCIFVILVLIQSSLGNSIDDAGSPILLNHAHQEFEHVNATLWTTNHRDKDDKICETISLQRILGVMMTMLRQDLSENSKTAYLLETLNDLLKNTAANNNEVIDKVDDLFRTLEKYKEPVYGNNLRITTDKNSPRRILVRKPTKPKEKLQFRYELPILSNSYCTEALVNIAKIASQAYASLAENPICNWPGVPDYPTKKDTPFSELSDLQMLDNPSLNNDPFQNILPVYPSNPILEHPKFDNLKDFKNALALYNPINLQNRPGELIPDVQEVPYESHPLYPGDVDQGYNPFSSQSSDSFPSDLYPHKPKNLINRPKQIPNGFNDQEVPYESNILYPGDGNQAYNPYSPQSLDSFHDLYHHKLKYTLNRPEELLPNELNDQEVPYESNPLYSGDVDQAYNPFSLQSPDSFPSDLYPHKPKDILNRPKELLPNELNDQEVPYESNPLYSGDVDQAYNPFSLQSPDSFPSDFYPHKPKDILNRPEELLPNELNDQEAPYESNPLYPGDVNQGYPFIPQNLVTSPFDLYPYKPKHKPNRPEELIPNVHNLELSYESNPLYPGDVNQAYNPFSPQSSDTLFYDLYSHKPHKNQPHSPFGEKPASNPLNNYSPNGKPMLPEELSLFPWENSQSPLTDFQPDQDLLNPENMAIDIPLNNPNAIDIPLNNPNVPNKYPFNLFGYPDTKNLKYVLPQTRPEILEHASLFHPYSPYNDNLAEQGLELPYDKFRPLFNFDMNNPHNPSASDTGYNPDVYDIQLNPNKLDSNLAPFKNPLNEYESEPDDASSDRDDYFSNEDDEKQEQSPYDFIPKTPSEIVPHDNYITQSSSLEDKDLKVIGFIREAIDAIEGLIPVIKFDPQTLSVIEHIKNILVNEDKDLEMNDYKVIVELYTNIINYIKQLNGYDQIIDRIDLSRVTNSSKLETKKVVELTYLVKRPKPVIYYPYYYVKYRLPYPSFVNAAQNLLKPKQLRMNPNQYEELLARSQVVETSPDLKHLKKHDLMGLIVQSGSLINAKLVGENATLSYHLDALKDITSDLSAEELLKLNNDASSKLNLLAADSESVNVFAPINEQSSRFELQEKNANSAINPVSPLPQILKINQMQGIANSETKLNSKIHPTREPSADLTTFDSTKLRSTLLRSEHVDLPFSDHSSNDNLLHNLYQPSSSYLPEREKMPPAVYKLIEETINTSFRGRNQQHLNSQANIDNDKIYWRTVEDNDQHPTNILNPEFNINTAQSFQDLKKFDNAKANAMFNQMYMINRPKTLEDDFKPTIGVLNNVGLYHQNIHDSIIPVSSENVEKTITQAGNSNIAQHSYGAPALLDPFDEQYFQLSDFVKQGSDDYDDQIRLKDQKSVAVNQDNIGSSDNGIRQITNQHSYFRNGPESLTQQNIPEPDNVLGQKQNMSASNIKPNVQAIPNQQNPPLLTSNQHTYTTESNPIFSGPKSIPSQQNNAPWNNKGSPGITNQQNYLETANPSQEKHLHPDAASPSRQYYLPPESNPANSAQQNNFVPAYYPRNPDQAVSIQQNYLPPGSYPVNSGQQSNSQLESHQILINPVSGQQVIPSQQGSGHGTLNQQNIGIYSSSPDSQQAITHKQHVYNEKDTIQETHSQQNDLSTGYYYENRGQHAIQDQQNPRTPEMWMNAESDQQIIPSQHSYGHGIGMNPSNPSAVQQAIVSQQNVYDSNNAMYGQHNKQHVNNAKDTIQGTHSQQNDLSTGYYGNLGQHAIQDQQNPRTQEMWMNAESDQQIIPSQHSYGHGIGMYPSNPSAVQQAIVSQQHVYDSNNAIYGQQNYAIGHNVKSYAIPQYIIYKRPIVQRYPLVTQYSRPIVTNYLG